MKYKENGVFSDNGFAVVGEGYDSEVIKKYLQPLFDKAKKGKFKMQLTSATNYNPNSVKYDYRTKYNLQNHLEIEFNFPVDYYIKKDELFGDGAAKGDYVCDIYTDRMSSEQYDNIIKLVRGYQYENLTDNQLIELANLIFERTDITGARVVRYTDISSGTPIWRIDAIAKSPITPKSKLYWQPILAKAKDSYIFGSKQKMLRKK